MEIANFARMVPDLNRIAKNSHYLWDVPKDADYQLINLSENATFKITFANHIKILRINRVGYHSSQAILSEIAWIEDLQKNNIITSAEILTGCNGEKLQQYQDDATGFNYHMLLFEFLSGEHLDETKNLIHHFNTLGTITAKLHQHAKKWCGSDSYPEDFTRLCWDFDGMMGKNPHWGSWQDAPGMNEIVQKLLLRSQEKIASNLNQYGKNADNFGLIHADLRLANFLVEDNHIKVLDFDDSGFSWFLYDIGSAFSFIENHPAKILKMIASWLQGYQIIAPLSVLDIKMIPTFIMIRRMVLMGWIGSHPSTQLAITQGADFTKVSV